MKCALIFGAAGQDGPYLAAFLARQGYDVVGCVPPWDPQTAEAARRAPDMRVVTGDLLDETLPIRLLNAVEPDEVYNLAALTFVPRSWDHPVLTMQSNGVAVVSILEAVRVLNLRTKVYQASTSEMFGSSPPLQRETTAMLPVSPYAVAKLFAHHACRVYRESYGVFAVSGILFNHESPWRGRDFVTRHITATLAAIKKGKLRRLPLGNLDAVRDWGHAADYVRAMWMMMQRDEPADFVIGTGVGRSVRQLLDVACEIAGVSSGVVDVDPARTRRVETADLIAEPTRANSELGWLPAISFEQMIEEMIDADLRRLERESSFALSTK